MLFEGKTEQHLLYHSVVIQVNWISSCIIGCSHFHSNYFFFFRSYEIQKCSIDGNFALNCEMKLVSQQEQNGLSVWLFKYFCFTDFTEHNRWKGS